MSADVDGSEVTASVETTSSSSLSGMSMHSLDGMASAGWLYASDVDDALIASSREEGNRWTKEKKRRSIYCIITRLIRR